MENRCLVFLGLFFSLQILLQCGICVSGSEESCRADDCSSFIQQKIEIQRHEPVDNALTVDFDVNLLPSLTKGDSSGNHCGALRKILRKEFLFKTQDAVKGLKTLDFKSILKNGPSLPELVPGAHIHNAALESMWSKYAKVFSSVSHDTLNAFKTIASHGDQANVTTEEYQHATKKALKDSIHDISKELGLNISNDSAAADTVMTKAQHLFDRLSDDAENAFKNITARKEKDGNANVTNEEYEKASMKTLKDAIHDISDEFGLKISDESAKVIDDLSEKVSAEAAKANPSQGQAQLVQESVHLKSNSKDSPEEGDTQSVERLMKAFAAKVGVSDEAGSGDATQDVRSVIDDGAEADSCSVFSGSWHQSEYSSTQGQKCDVYSVDSTQDGCSLSIVSKDAWWGERASLKANGDKVMIQVPTCGSIVEGTLRDDGYTILWDDGCEWTRSKGSWISTHWKTIGFGACVLAVLGAAFYLAR